MLRRQFVSLSLAATAFSSTRLMAQETTTDAGTPKAEVLEMVLGNPDAKVGLKEYASFTCSHCARVHIDVMPSLKADYIDTGKIKFISGKFILTALVYGPACWHAVAGRKNILASPTCFTPANANGPRGKLGRTLLKTCIKSAASQA